MNKLNMSDVRKTTNGSTTMQFFFNSDYYDY